MNRKPPSAKPSNPTRARAHKTGAKAGETVIAFGNEWRAVTPASDDDVTSAEKALSITFPAELRALLRDCSGGRPKKNYFLSRENNIEVGVGYVIPVLDQSRVRGLVSTCVTYRRTQALSPTLLPFAYDTGHANLVCLDTSTGAVVYWVHDDSAQRIRKVAPSAGAFLSGLMRPPF
jgi:hypothetical protein